MCVAHAGRDEHKSRSLSYLDDEEVDKTLTHKCTVRRVEKPRQQKPFESNGSYKSADEYFMCYIYF